MKTKLTNLAAYQILVIGLSVFTSIANAQAPAIQWSKVFGGSAEDRAYSIEQTPDGGFILSGRTRSSQSGDVSGQNNGNQDAWVIKTDSEGNILWERNYGGSGNEIAYITRQTGDGGYIFTWSSATANGDVSTNNGGVDYWIVRLNSTGDIVWEKSYGGSGNDFGYGLDLTSDGGYIVTGRTQSPPGGDVTFNHGSFDMWVLKLDGNGDLEWQKSLGSTGMDSGDFVIETSDGNYMVAGYSRFANGDVGANNGNIDAWVVKLNQQGDLLWEKNYGGTGNDYAMSIQETSSGGYVVAGYTYSPNDGDVSGHNGMSDMWVIKIDQNGVLEWQNSLGSSADDWGWNVRETQDGGYVIVGYACADNGDVSGAIGGCDYWVVKLNQNGNLLWQKPLGGTAFEEARSLALTSDGGIAVVGYGSSSDGDVGFNYGNDDIWLVKLSFAVSVADHSNVAVNVYPNPVRDALNVMCDDRIQSVAVYSLLGQQIMHKRVDTHMDVLDVTSLNTGLYMVEVSTQKGAQTFKIQKY